MTTAWLYLLVAGLFEIGWPAGLKLSQSPGWLAWGLVLAAASMGVSGTFLWLAQRDIPIGTAYAVWVGIGAAGTFALGVLAFGDAASLGKVAAVGLIVAGVIGLKLAQG